MKALITSALAVALIVTAGCGMMSSDNLPKTVDAKGIVTLDGTPIEGASIVCVPDGGEHPAFGMSISGGQFELKAFEAKEGACPGRYKVQVTRTIEVSGGRVPTAEELGEDAEHMDEKDKAGVTWVNDLPKKYANPNDSGIVIEIPESGITNLDLALTN